MLLKDRHLAELQSISPRLPPPSTLPYSCNTTSSAKDAKPKFYIERPLAKLDLLESLFCGVLTWKMHERDQSVCMHSDHKQLLEMK